MEDMCLPPRLDQWSRHPTTCPHCSLERLRQQLLQRSLELVRLWEQFDSLRERSRVSYETRRPHATIRVVVPMDVVPCDSHGRPRNHLRRVGGEVA